MKTVPKGEQTHHLLYLLFDVECDGGVPEAGTERGTGQQADDDAFDQ